MARVVLAMSGGVDSSVAAWLLKREGHDVVGLFMRHGVGAETACQSGDNAVAHEPADVAACERSPLGRSSHPTPAPVASPQPVSRLPVIAADEPPSHKKGCCTAADAIDARRVADRLDIPFYVLNFDDAFAEIIDYFVREYASGRTPNPCIVCNNWLKFGRLWHYAQSIGAERIATGHYARLVANGHARGVPRLCRGRDAGKDQSYVLFGIERSLLERLAFPVGEYDKHAIREIATKIGLPVAEKKDSQEICFVPDGDYAAFVDRRLPDQDRSGEIVTTDGRVVGRHEGVERFTIGQRRGLGVALGQPYYVVRIDREKRQVVVGRHDELGRQELIADEANWLVDPPNTTFRCQVQIRYGSRPAAATVQPLDERRFRVQFDQPQFGVAPGQAVVCYAGDQVLGGGWIR